MPERRDMLSQALQAIETLQSKLAAAERARPEPIAIVGLACRFPGAGSADAYWQLLENGRDAVTPVPPDRWDAAQYFDADPSAPGKMHAPFGGFLDEIALFDAAFFGIAGREAESMDPQQRLLLEMAWQALEDAAIPADRLAGSSTGVFVGITTADYARLAVTNSAAGLDVYTATGGALNVAAGRISYTLGLNGPAVAVDTACSSSLVALHLACQSLRARECDAALAGGVNALLTPEPFVCFAKWGMMAPDGHCKTFDERADGFVRSEGCGMLVLKRLSDAVAAGDRILAVVRGTAVNQDGASSGLTVPNGLAQQAVVSAALRAAELDPLDIDYVEAHGTGTKLGDPIELEALAEVLCKGRPADRPLRVGSVKTNIGHAESASGVAGLIKVVLAMQHEQIPPHLHFEKLSSRISLRGAPVEITARGAPWRRSARPRRAGVSSFGFSGTNAHAILEEPPLGTPAPPVAQDRSAHLLVLSARTEVALRNLAQQYADRLLHAAAPLADVCYTAAAGRAGLPARLALVASSPAAAASALASFVAGEAPAGVAAGHAGRPPKVAFLFTGQGSQYSGMGKALYETEPVFREAFDRCGEVQRSIDGQSLAGIVGYRNDAASADLKETRYTQPALFAFEYALAQLWMSWGIRPAALLGHSLGEYVAAAIANAVSAEDAMRLVIARAQLMQALPAGGSMAAAFAGEDEVARVLREQKGAVAIAAVNGPQNTVIAGGAAAVEAAIAVLRQRGVEAKPLIVSHAFHSPLVEPMLDALERAARGVQWRLPQIDLVSNLTGDLVSSGAPLDAAYWRRHAREPVRFADGVRTLERRGIDAYLEIGPAPVLLAMAKQCVARTDAEWLPSMRRDQDVWPQMLSSLGTLYARGAKPDWQAFDRPFPRRRVDLPHYPFQRKRFWLPASEQPRAARSETAHGGHPLLGKRAVSPLCEAQFECRLGLGTHPVLREHSVAGLVLLPAAAYIELGRAAAADVLETSDVRIVDGWFKAPLVLSGDVEREIQLIVSRGVSGLTFEVFSRARESAGAAPWTSHAGGRFFSPAPRSDESAAAARDACGTAIDAAAYQQRMAEVGLEYGPSFRALVAAWRGEREAFGELQLPEDDSLASEVMAHPGLLDAAFHLIGVALDGDARAEQFYLPVAFEAVTIARQLGRNARARARLRRADAARITADITLWTADGAWAGEILGLQARAMSRQQFREITGTAAQPLLEARWDPVEPSASVASSGAWYVLGGTPDFAAAVAGALAARGLAVERSPAPQSAMDAFLASGARGGGIVDLRGTEPATLHGTDVEALPSAVLDSGGGVSQTLQLLRAAASAAVAGKLRVVLVTQSARATEGLEEHIEPMAGAIWAMGVAVAAELPSLDLRLVDIDSPQAAAALVDAVLRSDSETRLAIRGARVLAERLTAVDDAAGPLAIPSGPYGLGMRERTLEGLALEPRPRRAPGPGQVEIEVIASGINFRDVLNLLDMYPGPPSPLGNECCGRVVALGPGVEGPAVGALVSCIAEATFDSHVIAEAALTFPVPPFVSLAQAAVLPIAQLTAYLALHEVGRMRADDCVLIHAGAGGVGLAAVHLALAAGARVFATAGSEEKREYLRKLGVREVFDSRVPVPASVLRAATDGRGFDLLLNSLTGDFIDEGLAAMAPKGRFLEIGLREVRSADEVAAARPDISYHPLLLGSVCRENPAVVQKMFGEILQLLETGRIPPPPVRAFALAEAESAFRFMAKARHIGRLALLHPRSSRCRPDTSYVITGGLGALGLHVAEWLVSRGATSVLLVGRSAPTEETARRISALRERGAAVEVVQADVASPSCVAQLRSSCPRPLAGIIHAAGVVDDAPLERTASERLIRVFRPKADGAVNLARLAAGRDLDFFVMFSSGSAMLGSPGQSAYASANGFLDAFAAQRRSAGLAALSIGWGAWEEGGMAARVPERVRQEWAARGIGMLSTAAALGALEAAIGHGATHVGIVPIDWRKFFAGQSHAPVPPLLAKLRQGTADGAGATAPQQPQWRESLRTMSPKQRMQTLLDKLRKETAAVLGIDPAEVDVRLGLMEQGMDSLMAVDLANRLSRLLGMSLPSTFAFDHPTLSALAEHVLEPVAASAAPPQPEEGGNADLESLSGDELERELRRELDEAGF